MSISAHAPPTTAGKSLGRSQGRPNNPDGSLPVLNERTEKLRTMLNAVHKLQLPKVSSFSSIKEFKQFCVGLLEPGHHPWDASLRHVKSRKRVSVGASLFLLRKLAPGIQGPDMGYAFLDKMSVAAPSVDPDFVSFAQKEIRSMFRPGWDRLYCRKVLGSTPGVNATKEFGRSRGGCRRFYEGDGFFALRAMQLGCAEIPSCPEVQVQLVPEKGKTRVVTVASGIQRVLSPLHDLIYSHISQFDWLLRGDAEPSVMSDFTLARGEVFCSGDYESATDNLSLELYQTLLETVAQTSVHVPQSIWRFAMDQSQPVLKYQERRAKLRRGQLMGSLLSFPFLCLTNYLSFKYLVRRDVPVKINGDDIVFRATRKEVKEWMEGVRRSGLTLSKGKTLVESNWFSINSTFFNSQLKRVRFIPVIRSLPFFSRPDSVQGMVGAYGACSVGFGGVFRSFLRSEFLLFHKNTVLSSHRSVTRGLGMACGEQSLRRAGLWSREQFYLGLPLEEDLPRAPLSSGGYWRSVIPPGWVRRKASELRPAEREVVPRLQRLFGNLCVSLSFLKDNFVKCDSSKQKRAYWQSVRSGGPSYSTSSLGGRGNRGTELYRRWTRLCGKAGTCFNVSRRLTVFPLPIRGCTEDMVWIPGGRDGDDDEGEVPEEAEVPKVAGTVEWRCFAPPLGCDYSKSQDGLYRLSWRNRPDRIPKEWVPEDQ